MTNTLDGKLRIDLIEAISLDQGWEESAVDMVDNVVTPIIQAYLDALQTEQSVDKYSNS